MKYLDAMKTKGLTNNTVTKAMRKHIEEITNYQEVLAELNTNLAKAPEEDKADLQTEIEEMKAQIEANDDWLALQISSYDREANKAKMAKVSSAQKGKRGRPVTKAPEEKKVETPAPAAAAAAPVTTTPEETPAPAAAAAAATTTPEEKKSGEGWGIALGIALVVLTGGVIWWKRKKSI